jgi:hypothetical protein
LEKDVIGVDVSVSPAVNDFKPDNDCNAVGEDDEEIEKFDVALDDGVFVIETSDDLDVDEDDENDGDADEDRVCIAETLILPVNVELNEGEPLFVAEVIIDSVNKAEEDAAEESDLSIDKVAIVVGEATPLAEAVCVTEGLEDIVPPAYFMLALPDVDRVSRVDTVVDAESDGERLDSTERESIDKVDVADIDGFTDADREWGCDHDAELVLVTAAVGVILNVLAELTVDEDDTMLELDGVIVLLVLVETVGVLDNDVVTVDDTVVLSLPDIDNKDDADEVTVIVNEL